MPQALTKAVRDHLPQHCSLGTPTHKIISSLGPLKDLLLPRGHWGYPSPHLYLPLAVWPLLDPDLHKVGTESTLVPTVSSPTPITGPDLELEAIPVGLAPRPRAFVLQTPGGSKASTPHPLGP